MQLSSRQKKYIAKHYRRKKASKIAQSLNVPEDKVREYIAGLAPRRPLSRKRKIVFSLITISIPLVFFLLLELTLRITQYGGNLDLFEIHESHDGKYLQQNPHYHDRFFYRTSTFTGGRGNVFLTEKPENGFRVFLLGASTSAGFPLGFNGMFSLVVDDMLTDALPDRHVEVVNLGITATNTYTLYDISRRIMDYEPDAVLIYSGQNEYYGALGVASAENIGNYPGFVRFYVNLLEMRTFLLVRDLMGTVYGFFHHISGGAERVESGTLMQRMAQQNAIPLDSRTYRAGINQFESNLDAVLRLYQKNNIPVFYSSLASNLKDHPPFYSVDTPGHPTAQEVFDDAVAAHNAGEYRHALEQFRYARDLDALRFRAPSVFNEIIREKVDRYGAHYVPVKETLSARAENGIIGFDLMLEHLHPNEEGYFLMGKTFFEALAGAFTTDSAGVETAGPAIFLDTTLVRDPDYYRRAMRTTELDRLIVRHRIKILKNSWPFVEEHDPEGYPANYIPEGRIDSLAYNHVHYDEQWVSIKMEAAQWIMDQGRTDEALDEVMGVTRVLPYESEAFENAALIATQGERSDLAAEFLEEAYRINPSNYNCRTLAGIMINREQYERAAALYEEAYRHDMSDLNSLYNASVAHAAYQNYDRAIDLADRLSNIQPDFPDLQRWREHVMRISAQTESR